MLSCSPDLIDRGDASILCETISAERTLCGERERDSDRFVWTGACMEEDIRVLSTVSSGCADESAGDVAPATSFCLHSVVVNMNEQIVIRRSRWDRQKVEERRTQNAWTRGWSLFGRECRFLLPSDILQSSHRSRSLIQRGALRVSESQLRLFLQCRYF